MSLTSLYQKVPVVDFPTQVTEGPLVSVCVQTYQHSKYIEKCIEGILKQETDFPIEILLGDDESTDGTRETCIKYAEKYPEKIRLFLHSRKNNITVGGKPTGRFNLFYNLFSAKGKYIALCEGDDYWTDPLKLQKQIDYISNNENCNLVFTDVQLLDQSESKFESNWADIRKNIYQFKDLVERNVITTCTVIFRNPNKNAELHEWLKHFTIGDYPLYLFLLRNGYAYYLNDITAVYRQHTGGIFSLKGIEYLINKNLCGFGNHAKLIAYQTGVLLCKKKPG